jgi:hypothetical protein
LCCLVGHTSHASMQKVSISAGNTHGWKSPIHTFFARVLLRCESSSNFHRYTIIHMLQTRSQHGFVTTMMFAPVMFAMCSLHQALSPTSRTEASLEASPQRASRPSATDECQSLPSSVIKLARSVGPKDGERSRTRDSTPQQPIAKRSRCAWW